MYMKDKTITAILALFVGGFGIHRFYLRQNGQGLLYLVFFWTAIPAIVAFVDCIGFLIMDKFNAKYNSAIEISKKNKEHVAEELEKLHELKEKGIVSEEEYEKRKKGLLE
jgi:TM2 domain-containing membrane protein YozV